MAFGIPESTIEEIKARTDLADLIAGYGIAVKRAGGAYKACCPFHSEKTPSFHIQPDKGFYHCFGCGESGDAITFVMKREGLSFVEAVKKLAANLNIAIEEREDPQAGLRKRLLALHAELAAFYRRCLCTAKEAAPARAYLESRDLSGEVAERFQIGYAPLIADAMLTWAGKHGFTTEELEAASVLKPSQYAPGRWYSPFAGRLMFAIRDRAGRVIAFSGRTLETDKTKMRGGKYVNSFDSIVFRKSEVLYAFDIAAGKIANAKPIREAIVCEGQIDVIRCHACGFDRAVASQGTSFTKEHVQMLKRVADAAVLVFDGDAAGRKAAIHTGGDMIEAGMSVRVARLPPGDDPDSLLRTKGAEAFQACLDAAESIVAYQVGIAREAEKNPDSYDAISRAANAVLALVRRSSSAVMRASLLQEASTLLKIPVRALEEELEKGAGRVAVGGKVRPAVIQEASPAASGNVGEMDTTNPPSQVQGVPSEDAAAPENEPFRKTELEFMEFLYGNRYSNQLADMLESYAPSLIFVHGLTCTFVAAYIREARGDQDALMQIDEGLSVPEARMLEKVFLMCGRAARSGLAPVDILKNLLRRLWMDAARRRLGEMPVSNAADAASRRLALSLDAKKYQNAPWPVASSLMCADRLK
jgi:DNA primase